MIDSLITSKTRIKLLLKFFLNSATTSYLRNLEEEFGESTNAIRIELNRLEEAGLLTSENIANKKFYRANTSHPLFPEINNIVKKYLGIDKIAEEIIAKLGDVQTVYLVGRMAKGLNADVIQLLIVSDNIDLEYLDKLVDKASSMIDRKISYVIASSSSAPTVVRELDSKLMLYNKD